MEDGFKKVLLVGINYSGDPYKVLRGCIRDIFKLLKKLNDVYPKHNYGTYKIITDRTMNGPDNPSRENILEGLKWLVSDLQHGDSVYFHYSGHGEMVDGKFRLLSFYNKKIEYIYCDELRKFLVDKIPADCKCFVTFDCCSSGNSLSLPCHYDVSGNMELINTGNESDGLVVFLGACKHNEVADDIYGQRHLLQFGGTMLNSFMDAFTKDITIKNLYGNICESIKKWGYTQNPQLYSSRPINIEQSFLLL